MLNPCARIALVIALTLPLLRAAPVQASERGRDVVRRAMSDVCGKTGLSGLEVQALIPGSWLLEESYQPNEAMPARMHFRLALTGGDELMLEARLANGELRQFRASFLVHENGEPEPRLLAIADGSCTVRSAREIRKEDAPRVFLDQLDGDLETLRWTETLQAPWPDGVDPGGVRVALVDSGLAYDLPLFADRLARDTSGEPIGFDFWDMDRWPYDGDTSRGAFLPIRHGTAVASILAREAPEAALVPYRYPRPDMRRLSDLIDHALEHGIKIVAMPLGSRTPEDREAFEHALKDKNILAIVSAGNDGRNIDEDPVFPAALTLENILTVTSADAFGRLASGSNWGGKSVDLMLPAENIEVTDFRGATGVTSGSSYAVPRLAALAARILAEEPDLTVPQLKAKILERAAPSPFERDGVVAAGWLPDPEAD